MKPKIEIAVREHTEIKMTPKEFVKFIAPKVGMEYPFENVKGCRKRGYLTFNEFLILAYSKTPRQRNNYIKNKPEEVEDITREAFKQKDLDSIILKLTELHGVGVPVASYLLTAWNPKDYGTLDFRMKDILEKKCDEDFKKPKKESSDLEWYKAELDLLRKWRDELGIETCRQVEYALWTFQQMTSDSGEKSVEMEV